MLSRYLNTLNYHANKLEKEWRSKSKLRAEYAYGPLKEILFFLSRSPLKWSLIIFSIFGTISLIVTKFHFFQIQTVPIQLQKSELLDYFTIIWSIQTTIAALIYPIVISFISLLLQKRNDARSYLNIYLHDTASIFSGLNALFLIILIGVQYMFIPTAQETTVLNWIFINTTYLLLNLVLVTYFLYQTFLYIKPISRKESLKSYLINETWPSDFKNLVKTNLFLKAADDNSLLKFNELENNQDKGKNLTFETGYIFDWNNSYEVYFSKTLKHDSHLVDVRLNFLKWACKAWARKAINHKSENQALSIIVIPGQKYSGQIILCKTQGYQGISLYQMTLFKLAFKFKKDSKINPLRIEDLLQDLKAEVLRSLQSRDVQGFEVALEDLREFIVLLIKSSQTPDINLSSLRTSNFWNETKYEEWINTLNEIIKRACQLTDESNDFLPRLIILPHSILYDINDVSDEYIKNRVILLLKKIDYEISTWWIKKLENQGELDHSICNPAKLSPPFQTSYINMLTDFLGGWEQIKNNNILPQDIKKLDWHDLKRIHFLLKNHLATTVKLLRNALSTGDISKSEFMLDSLLKWYSSMRSVMESNYGRILDPSGFINDSLMEWEWTKIKNEYDFNNITIFNEKESSVVISILINNLWVDYTCVFLFWLSRQYNSCEDKDKSLIVDVYRRIKEGDHPLKTGSIIPDPKPLSNIIDLFEAVLRMRYSGFISELNYNQNIDAYIRSVFDQFHINMISGRSYSGSGGEDLSTMRDGILFTLINFINDNWNPVTRYEDKIEDWIINDVKRITLLKRDFTSWINRLMDSDFSKYENFYNDLHPNNNLSFDDAKEVLITGLKVFNEKVDEIWDNMIVKTEFDGEKLKNIELTCSKLVVNSIGQKFPFNLFKNLNYTDEKLSKKGSALHSDFDKGSFTRPRLKAFSPNDDFYFETVLTGMQLRIWQEVYESLKIKETEIKEPEEYWENLIAYESKILEEGGTPILLLNSFSDPDWIYSWIHDISINKYEKPKELVFSKKRSIDSTSYFGKLNNIEVHVARTFIGQNQSLLITKEVFEKLEFQLIDKDQIISLDLTENIDEKKVDLNFNWSFEIDVKNLPVVLLKHNQDLNEL